MSDKPMDVEQLADWFQVSIPTVHRWLRDGAPCLRPSPGVVRFDLASVTEWAKSRPAKAAS